MHIHNEIIDGDTTIQKIEEDQKHFKSKLNETTTGNPKHKLIRYSENCRKWIKTKSHRFIWWLR